MRIMLSPEVLDNREIVAAIDDLSKQLTRDDLELLKAVLQENEGNEYAVLKDLAGYTYRHWPVSVRTFVEDPKFLGLKGQIFPRLLNDLEELFEGDYVEAILCGAIGWGKSTFAEIAMCRMIYEISCFRNPQKVYGLMKGSVIALINVSVQKMNAQKIVFQGIKSKLVNSPYFNALCPPDQHLTSELRFPNNLWVFPVASTETGIIGYNVFGGVMDEVNFMGVVEKSKAAGGKTYDHAVTLQEALIRRMKSRFMRKGKLPGILLQISSSRYPEDYTERRMREADDDPSIFVRRYSQWDTIPRERFSSKTFFVSLGDSIRRPEIFDRDEETEGVKADGIPVIEIPMDFRRDFERDVDAAIRDLAGLPTLTIKPYITYRWKIAEAVERGRAMGLEHPFTSEVSTLQDGATFDLDKLLLTKLKRRIEAEKKPSLKIELEDAYKNYRSRPRFVHGDLSLTTDATGVAMGFVLDYTSVERRNEEGKLFVMKAPIIVIEFMLRVVPPRGGEIEIASIRSLIYELRSYGYGIRYVSFDQFQSADSMQQLKRSGIESGHLSADTDPMVYGSLKDALYEDRLIMYDYPIVGEELLKLEKNEKTGRVDHPPRGSKDVSDAVAGVCYHCVSRQPPAPAPPPMKGVLYEGEREEKDSVFNVPILKSQ